MVSPHRSLVLLGLVGTLMSMTSSAIAAPSETCVPLKEVTTDTTEIRKQVQKTLISGNNNWNTDFAVPPGTTFRSYRAVFTPENDAAYEVSIILKYNNGTSDTAYTRNVPLQRNKIYTLPFQSATLRQPVQVNMRVGGANNNAYRVSVQACL